jgi:hypothetical protein
MKKINIGSTERGLLFVNSQFKQILKPGSYRFWNLMDSNRIGIFDIAQRPELTEPITKFIAKEWSAELQGPN